jgi:protein MpaA
MSSITRKTFFTGVCVLTAVFVSGCAEIAQTVDNVLHLRPGYIHIAGRTVRGRAIEYSIHGTGSQTVLILGAIHGDEPKSATLTGQLQKYLLSTPLPSKSVRVIVLPIANPDGLAAGTRGNTNGVDLNRNFPTANRVNCAEFGLRALTEPESVAIIRLIGLYKPSRIVSVHQPLSCVDYDGPAEGLAQAVASAGNLPVRRLGSMPGSLGSYAGETLNIPIITLELPTGTESLDEFVLWELYKHTLLTAITYQQ